MPGRSANAVDFWRGIALIMIFIDHVPGNIYSSVTMARFAFCDAAELFVFLAGWSLSLATGGAFSPHTPGRVIIRLLARAIEIYRAQLVLTAIALAILAGTALLRNNPIFLEWHNAGPAFFDPVKTTIGWVLLTHQLWFFDILPLYVVLLLMAPGFIILARWNRLLALSASLLLYVCVLTFNLRLPSWPGESGWLFNPLAWQLLLVLGFLMSDTAQDNTRFRRWAPTLVWPAAGCALIIAVLSVRGVDLDPLSVPEPRAFFLLDKTSLSPLRVLSLLVLVAAFHQLYHWARDRLGRAGDFLCGLGRNSLAVFGVSSLLSLCGQLFRFIIGGGLTIDTITVVLGILLMGCTAWFVEWRTRSPNSASRLS